MGATLTSVQSACAYAHVHPGTVHVHDVLAYARIVLYYAYIRRLRLACAARRVCTCAMCISGHACAYAGGLAGGVSACSGRSFILRVRVYNISAFGGL